MNELKYVDPKADVMFKKVFGEHPDLLVSLLNALLPLPDDCMIASIEYLPTEVLPDDPLHKDSIVDVRCKDQDGRQFLVEMQMIWTPDYSQRALFNAAKAYSRELPRGGHYASLKTVYSLNLLNQNLDSDVPQWYHHYRLEHAEIKGKTIDGLQLVFVELKKFKPQTWAERKTAVLWLRFLTEIDGQVRAAPRELVENPEVNKALEMVEIAALSPEDRAHYDGFQDWLCRETRRANAERKMETMKVDLATMKVDLATMTAERDAMTAERDAIKAGLETMTAERDAMTAERDAMTAERDAMTAERDVIKAGLETMTAERDAMTAERDAAQVERDAAQVERDAAQVERDAAREQLFKTARNLKAMGLAIPQIADLTGLPKEQIEGI